MAVALFAFIILVPNIVRDMLGYVLSGQLSLKVFVELIVTLAPFAITYALPMGLLTGVLLTLGRLSADSEITAMRAAGIGIKRIAWPALALATMGVGLALYFNFEAMPHARVNYERRFAEAVRSNPLNIIVPKTFIRDFSGFVIYVGDKQGDVLHDIWIWELDDSRRVKRLDHAGSGRIERFDEATNSLILRASDYLVEQRNPKDPERFVTPEPVGGGTGTGEIVLSLDRFFGHAGGVHIKQDWLTYSELQVERARLAALPLPADQAAATQARRDRMKLELVFQDKINMSLAVLSLALVGVPLGIRVSRRETTANFAVAVAVAITYYLLTLTVKSLDRHPEYRPDLLLWLPNVLLLAWGGWLMSRIEKR